MTLSPEFQSLIRAAQAAATRAYAPYSRFQVGAALLGANGILYTGANVENASYGATICAERAALCRAVDDGCTRFLAIAIVTQAEEPTPPCGICRQVLMEFSPDMPVISATQSGKIARWTLDALLPAAFSPASLKVRE